MRYREVCKNNLMNFRHVLTASTYYYVYYKRLLPVIFKILVGLSIDPVGLLGISS